MARAIWSGALNFGLVTVPVELYGATQDHTIHFRQFQRGTSDRIRYRRVNERTGEEVPYDEIVKGYDLGGEEYVIIEPRELDEIAPGRSKTIDIDAFVGLEEIDPIYFQKTYWLAPAKEEFGRAYSLLLDALSKTNRVGLARLVMRGKEYIAAVRAGDGVLMLNTLLFPEDIKQPNEVVDLPELGRAGEREVDMAVNLIESMAEEWNPEDYHDTYTERVMRLIEDKRAGRTITPAEEPREPTRIVDLFEALSRSVEGRRQQSGKPTERDKTSTTEEPRRAKPSRSKRTEPTLSELTKGDLDRMARDLGIKGRSKMNRAELEKAIKDASRRQKRRRAS
ncbi:non-homologous end joining protein Ku [Saccharomonospora glauca]|uniref:Non-homologous end joining protein Ku n=1 Tax=Saccharomonospora glauca K62 TaxID=928724 RepID=I1CWX7_9PSEU|nr:Ku protein [Saccharomonospora glauca]EIE97201.1 Ku protein [Saccharomonospora glauca K62]